MDSSRNNGNGAAELKERRKKTFHSFRRGQSRREISPSQYRETCSNSTALPSLHWSLFVQQNAKIEAEGKDYLPSYSLKGGRKEGISRPPIPLGLFCSFLERSLPIFRRLPTSIFIMCLPQIKATIMAAHYTVRSGRGARL